MTDGKPNRTAEYNIRGTTSIGQKGSALILIDGVEGDPSMLNPNDIASVSLRIMSRINPIAYTFDEDDHVQIMHVEPSKK